MNIKSINSRYIENPYQNKTNKIDKVMSRASDKVEISKEAKYLSEINKSKEELNSDKISEIKDRIKSGTYNVDSKNLARKILDHIKGDK